MKIAWKVVYFCRGDFQDIGGLVPPKFLTKNSFESRQTETGLNGMSALDHRKTKLSLMLGIYLQKFSEVIHLLQRRILTIATFASWL